MPESESPARGKQGFHWGSEGGRPALHISMTRQPPFRFNSARHNDWGVEWCRLRGLNSSLRSMPADGPKILINIAHSEYFTGESNAASQVRNLVCVRNRT